jgi:hypothetical protein
MAKKISFDPQAFTADPQNELPERELSDYEVSRAKEFCCQLTECEETECGACEVWKSHVKEWRDRY